MGRDFHWVLVLFKYSCMLQINLLTMNDRCNSWSQNLFEVYRNILIWYCQNLVILPCFGTEKKWQQFCRRHFQTPYLLNGRVLIPFKISLSYVHYCPNDNLTALIQIMAQWQTWPSFSGALWHTYNFVQIGCDKLAMLHIECSFFICKITEGPNIFN